jgi:hypothetical protein
MIKFFYEKLMGKKAKPTRAEVLASRPIRNPSVEWERQEREGEGDEAPRNTELMLLKVPRRKDKMGNLAAKMFKLPEFKKIELDEIGSDVWEWCDGTNTVEALTKAICTKYRLNRRQGETSVTAYLRMLAERRLIAVRTGAKASSTKSKASGTATAATKGVAAVPSKRRQKRA